MGVILFVYCVPLIVVNLTKVAPLYTWKLTSAPPFIFMAAVIFERTLLCVHRVNLRS